MNDGACLIYEGNSYPGQHAKISLLECEYGTLDIRHKDWVVNDAGHIQKHKQDLTHDESKVLQCCLEHDRLLYNGCDRQQHLLANDQIDEFDCLSVDDSSSGWCMKPDPNDSLMIGGLRSPCMNACYDEDYLDRTGRVLTSFDGVFEFEREKEFIYLECNIRSLKETFNNKGVRYKDLTKECRINKTIAHVRLSLDKYGLANSIPQSTVCVDEDYWYMKGGNCVVDDPDGKWPCTSIFHTRDPKSIKLNSTSSQTVHGVPDEVVAERLKEILFKNCRDSRSEFFELHKVCHTTQQKQDSSLGRHSCCECSYIKCHHYEDVSYISREARQYYQAVCPKCVMKIGHSCH